MDKHVRNEPANENAGPAIRGNGSPAAASAEPPTYKRHALTPKQQEFFRQNKMAMQQIEAGMKGALQLIMVEAELKGKLTLADDCSELIIEEEGAAAPVSTR